MSTSVWGPIFTFTWCGSTAMWGAEAAEFNSLFTTTPGGGNDEPPLSAERVCRLLADSAAVRRVAARHAGRGRGVGHFGRRSLGTRGGDGPRQFHAKACLNPPSDQPVESNWLQCLVVQCMLDESGALAGGLLMPIVLGARYHVLVFDRFTLRRDVAGLRVGQLVSALRASNDGIGVQYCTELHLDSDHQSELDFCLHSGLHPCSEYDALVLRRDHPTSVGHSQPIFTLHTAKCERVVAFGVALVGRRLGDCVAPILKQLSLCRVDDRVRLRCSEALREELQGLKNRLPPERTVRVMATRSAWTLRRSIECGFALPQHSLIALCVEPLSDSFLAEVKLLGAAPSPGCLVEVVSLLPGGTKSNGTEGLPLDGHPAVGDLAQVGPRCKLVHKLTACKVHLCRNLPGRSHHWRVFSIEDDHVVARKESGELDGMFRVDNASMVSDGLVDNMFRKRQAGHFSKDDDSSKVEKRPNYRKLLNLALAPAPWRFSITSYVIHDTKYRKLHVQRQATRVEVPAEIDAAIDDMVGTVEYADHDDQLEDMFLGDQDTMEVEGAETAVSVESMDDSAALQSSRRTQLAVGPAGLPLLVGQRDAQQ